MSRCFINLVRRVFFSIWFPPFSKKIALMHKKQYLWKLDEADSQKMHKLNSSKLQNATLKHKSTRAKLGKLPLPWSAWHFPWNSRWAAWPEAIWALVTLAPPPPRAPRWWTGWRDSPSSPAASWGAGRGWWCWGGKWGWSGRPAWKGWRGWWWSRRFAAWPSPPDHGRPTRNGSPSRGWPSRDSPLSETREGWRGRRGAPRWQPRCWWRCSSLWRHPDSGSTCLLPGKQADTVSN